MYKSITINNLRGIDYLKIDGFKQFNLIVGKNNCGKTTILEGLFLLIAPTNAELTLKINAFRGVNVLDENLWRLLFKNLDVNSTVDISGDFEKREESRKLIIKPNFSGSSQKSISKEQIENSIFDIKHSYSETSPNVNGLNLEYYSNINGKEKVKTIKTKIMLKGGEFNWILPKDYKEPLKGVFLNYKTIFNQIGNRFGQIKVKKQTKPIIDIIRKIEPQIEDLTLYLNEQIYCDIGLNDYVPINVMGDGILRVLSIILTIMNTENGIVLIDEIDNGLHYSTQEIMWNGVFHAAKKFNVQIFATAHSIETVKSFNSAYKNLFKSDLFKENDDIRLFRIERDKDKSNYVSYDHDKLAASLESGWEIR